MRKIYSWDSNKTIKENADANGIGYHTMSAIRRRRCLKCVSYKETRLGRLMTKDTVNFLYSRGFTYEDLSRLFKCHISTAWKVKRKTA